MDDPTLPHKMIAINGFIERINVLAGVDQETQNKLTQRVIEAFIKHRQPNTPNEAEIETIYEFTVKAYRDWCFINAILAGRVTIDTEEKRIQIAFLQNVGDIL
jgi:hypothetical protein